MYNDKLTYKPILIALNLFFVHIEIIAQCPPNIGFENGNFDNWNCGIGEVDHNGTVNIFLQGVDPNRHVIIKKTGAPQLDPYGHFPIISPNGSKYSIKLGNNITGAQAERVSYTFTVPSNRNDYSIIYNYAVVFQDPGHLPFQQPRFTAKIFDVDDNTYVNCSSYDFVASSNLPGFALSDSFVNGSKNVYYKPWSIATIKLAGYAGKKIRLEFTTNDCTEGEHFGYAYIDVNSDCAPVITGNTTCKGSPSITLTAPYGYAKYQWYDATITTLLDTMNILKIKPPPPAGTVYGLVVTPFPGSGCLDTLYTTIQYTNAPFVFDIPDSITFCLPEIGDLTSSSVTTGSSPGLAFSYYLDSTQLYYLSNPDSLLNSGLFYIKAVDTINGCNDIRPINVVVDSVPDISVINPSPVHYPGSANISFPSVVFGNTNGLSFTYWANAITTISVPNPSAVDSSGVYYIKATKPSGCSTTKPVEVLITIPPPPNAFSPNGDGIHDYWQIPGLLQNPSCTVDIFNRYGQPIFHSKGYNKPWDGKVNGKKVPEGTYYYIINLSKKLTPIAGYVDVIY